MNKTLNILRLKKGYTQKELAQVVGINPTTYNNYERGVRKIPKGILKKLAQVLEIEEEKIKDDHFKKEGEKGFKRGDLVLYKVDKYIEIGKVYKTYDQDKTYVCYTEGETAALTANRSLRKISKEEAQKLAYFDVDNLGGDRMKEAVNRDNRPG